MAAKPKDSAVNRRQAAQPFPFPAPIRGPPAKPLVLDLVPLDLPDVPKSVSKASPIVA
jgi:hypothetical protein